MSGDDPYAGHNPLGVLLLTFAGLIGTPWLIVHGIRLLLPARRARTDGAVLKAARSLTGAAALGVYTWGLLHLFFLDESGQSRACASAIGARRLTGYEPSFVPLHFGCRTSGGHTVEAVVPGWVNPVAAVLVVAVLVLTWACRSLVRTGPGRGPHQEAPVS
ncbi:MULTISPECIES: hypothetical protein [unclassified Streptomyces]|uniref:hypothetical protein n=1 Tax=unclassified Streptomyces TaxID=2593676 RepID=UPI003316C0D2